jgi:hypothetical protein
MEIYQMSAPQGNQFWKLRSTHGRELIFSSPEILWQACIEYFESTDNRKWIKKDWVGKDAHEVLREVDTPYTLTGLFVFLDITAQTWSKYVEREGFSEIISRIKQIMYTQKFEGASVGAFNANIIARDLGLREESNINVNDARKATSDLFPFKDESKQEEE